MKRNIFSILLLVVLGSVAMLLLSGCDKEETLTPQDFAPPTNFRALSKDTSVVLYWTHSTAWGVSDFAGYRVQTYNASNVKIDSAFTTNNTYTLHNPTNRGFGLTNGSKYSFTIRAVKSNGDLSIIDSLQWGPTDRFLSKTIYEFDASGQPSGIQFSTGTPFPFTSGIAPGTTDNRLIVDLWIDGRNNSDPLLKSPHDHSLSTGWRTTKLFETTATSLDQQVNIPPESSFRTSPGLTITPGKVYLAITQDGNYVRFQVSNAGIQGTLAGDDRRIEITVVYNTGDGKWAKK